MTDGEVYISWESTVYPDGGMCVSPQPIPHTPPPCQPLPIAR
jgi:hypothetical protein